MLGTSKGDSWELHIQLPLLILKLRPSQWKSEIGFPVSLLFNL